MCVKRYGECVSLAGFERGEGAVACLLCWVVGLGMHGPSADLACGSDVDLAVV